MDVWNLAKLLFGRWYVVLPMIVLTAWTCAWLRTTVKPDYTATTHVQLVPPQKIMVGTTVREPVNPYLDLGLGSLSELARVSLEGQSVAERLQAAGLSDTFTVTVDQFSPLVTIQAEGHTEAQATGTAGQLAALFMQSVADYQKNQGVGPKDLVLTQRVPAGDKIETNPANVQRAVTAVAAAGVVLSVGLTVGLDAVAKRLRRRTRPAGHPAGPAIVWPGTPGEPADEPALPVRQRGTGRSIGGPGPYGIGGDTAAPAGFAPIGVSRPTGRASVYSVEGGAPAVPSGISVSYRAGSIASNEISVGPAGASGVATAGAPGDAFGGIGSGPLAGTGPTGTGPARPPDWPGQAGQTGAAPDTSAPGSTLDTSAPATPAAASDAPQSSWSSAANLPAHYQGSQYQGSQYQGVSPVPDVVRDPDAGIGIDEPALAEMPYDATVLLPLSFKGPSSRDGSNRPT